MGFMIDFLFRRRRVVALAVDCFTNSQALVEVETTICTYTTFHVDVVWVFSSCCFDERELLLDVLWRESTGITDHLALELEWCLWPYPRDEALTSTAIEQPCDVRVRWEFISALEDRRYPVLVSPGLEFFGVDVNLATRQ